MLAEFNKVLNFEKFVIYVLQKNTSNLMST